MLQNHNSSTSLHHCAPSHLIFFEINFKILNIGARKVTTQNLKFEFRFWRGTMHATFDCSALPKPGNWKIWFCCFLSGLGAGVLLFSANKRQQWQDCRGPVGHRFVADLSARGQWPLSFTAHVQRPIPCLHKQINIKTNLKVELPKPSSTKLLGKLLRPFTSPL